MLRLFSHVLLPLVLSGLVVSPVSANPVPADDLSIANGFENYDQLCAGCHGTKVVAGDELWYEPDPYEEDIDYDALIDEVQEAREREEERRFANVARRDGSGRWAEIPDPGNKANEASVRAQIMEELVAEIDREYGTEDEVVELDPFSTDYDIGEDLGFDHYGELDALPDAPDLADPESFVYGTDEQSLYDAIAKGIGSGTTMPGFRARLGSDEAVWDIVNYIRSLWGPEWLE